MDRQRLSPSFAGVLTAVTVVFAAMASPAYGRPTHPPVDVDRQVAFADHVSATPAARSVDNIRRAGHGGGPDRLTALMVWVAVMAVYTASYARAFCRQLSWRPSLGTTLRCMRAPSRAPPISSARTIG